MIELLRRFCQGLYRIRSLSTTKAVEVDILANNGVVHKIDTVFDPLTALQLHFVVITLNYCSDDRCRSVPAVALELTVLSLCLPLNDKCLRLFLRNLEHSLDELSSSLTSSNLLLYHVLMPSCLAHTS
jgi:hypothetical protein